MALYEFQTSVYLGWSHSGEVVTTGEGTINLSDEEVGILISQMKVLRSKDYRKLKLSRRYPKLYNKLRRNYRKVAYETEELYWLINGLEEGYYEYDEIELVKYCIESCGLDPYELYEYYDESEDEEERYELVLAKFGPWLTNYVKTLHYKEAIEFFYGIMEVQMDFDESYFSNSYSTILPQKIIEMAS